MLIFDRPQYRVYINNYSKLETFESPFLCAAYVLLLIEDGNGHLDEERELLATRAILSNCRYALCAGAFEKDWMRVIRQMFVDSDFPDTEMVITSRSGGRPLGDLIELFFACDRLDDITYTNFLIITINRKTNDNELLAQAVHNYFS